MSAARPLRRLLVAARSLRLTALAAALTLALALVPASAHAAFQVGLQDVAFDGDASAQQAADGYNLLRTVHGSLLRLNAFWYAIAPVDQQPGFQGSNPSDPQYRWSALDTAVRNAAAHGATAVLTLSGAPTWAQGPNKPDNPAFGFGVWDPNPTDYAQFIHAVATRYNGRFPDPQSPGQVLPRVRYFEIWNEENIPLFMAAPDLAASYRALLSGAYAAIKGVDPTDKVVLGGLAPLAYKRQCGTKICSVPGSAGPLKLAAQLMCLHRVGTHFAKTGNCTAAPFDIFAEHPYSLGVSPTERSTTQFYDDVRVGDFFKVRNLLTAAERLHTVGNSRPPLWVTEWGWATNPPDRQEGDPFKAAARYVAYSMYEMYKQGASLVVWQEIHDPSNNNGLPGAGLETRSGQRKPSLQAFAFPFIASVRHGRGFGWGRAPVSQRVRVFVQRRTGRRWKTVASARSGSDGIFSVHFGASGNATYRAQVSHGPRSLGYNSAAIPPRNTH